MSAPEPATPRRKMDHLRICLENDVERGFSGFSDVRLVHNALPECDLQTVDTSTVFLHHRLRSPLFIAAMTGGHPGTREVNVRLARAAARFGIGMGVGSQRAALENPEFEDTFSIVREEAPEAFIVANLGIVQLRDEGIEWAERAVDMIGADAIAIHLNFLQEAIQPEGDHDASGCLDALHRLCDEFKYPVIIKETGSGISAETARRCFGAGVAAIDTGGWGGTSWAAIEGVRAEESPHNKDKKLISLRDEFTGWGIPTVVSLREIAPLGGPVIATGGIRSGVDMAKAIALGGSLGGMALPLLQPAMKGEQELFERIDAVHEQFRVAMFLTGSRTVADLKSARTYITGCTREMLCNRMEE
jgi:isopentenyl-diphosphate delta-isomerase